MIALYIMGMVYASLIPSPPPRFYITAVEKNFSPWLWEKFWEEVWEQGYISATDVHVTAVVYNYMVRSCCYYPSNNDVIVTQSQLTEISPATCTPAGSCKVQLPFLIHIPFHSELALYQPSLLEGIQAQDSQEGGDSILHRDYCYACSLCICSIINWLWSSKATSNVIW